MTVPQVTLAYFGGDCGRAQRAISNASARGLTKVTTELVRPRRTVTPIAVIRPGEVAPSAEWVAYAGNQRWSDSFAPMRVVHATVELVSFVGGEKHVIPSGHLSHEVALTDVFLLKRSVTPNIAWRSVEASVRGVRPDAVSGEVMIELVGQYSGASLSAKMELSGIAILELW